MGMATPNQFSPDQLMKIRSDFPLLSETINGKPVAYLDSAASAQKPSVVLEAEKAFYEHDYANIHRGVHVLSQRATEAYENARKRIASYLGTDDPAEVIFTKGTTESVNLVCSSFVEPMAVKGGRILISEMEHHANIVPWQLLAERYGVELVPINVSPEGELDIEDYDRQLALETPLFVSLVWVSNSLGTINPIKSLIDKAHAAGSKVLVDGAQALPHMRIDLKELDCDFLAFSGHKTYGPTGIGVLYGKKDLLQNMRPYQGGGDMIEQVSFSGTTFKGPPERFEAGTPNIAGAIGLAKAIDYMEELGVENIASHEAALLEYATERVSEVDGLKIWGNAKNKASVVSFTLESAHSHDIGTFLDADGIAVRTGHHCCQPMMSKFGISGTTRASFAAYNSTDEIDRLAESLTKINAFFG